VKAASPTQNDVREIRSDGMRWPREERGDGLLEVLGGRGGSGLHLSRSSDWSPRQSLMARYRLRRCRVTLVWEKSNCMWMISDDFVYV